jgi:hypothetical protein
MRKKPTARVRGLGRIMPTIAMALNQDIDAAIGTAAKGHCHDLGELLGALAYQPSDPSAG